MEKALVNLLLAALLLVMVEDASSIKTIIFGWLCHVAVGTESEL